MACRNDSRVTLATSAPSRARAAATIRGGGAEHLLVQVEGFYDPALVERLHQLVAERRHGPAVVVGDGGAAAPRGVDLQQDPDLVGLDELVHGQALHDRGLVRFPRGQTRLIEPADGRASVARVRSQKRGLL